MLIASFGSLNIKKRSWGLGIAEGNLAQATFDDQLSGLGAGLGSLNGALNLLLHPLHVVVASAAIPSSSKSVVGLEQIRLCELAGWLLGVLAWSTADLAEDLVVEVFRDCSLRASLIEVARGGHELLELDSSNEVLVLRCHQAVVLSKKSNLVVSLRTLGVFLEKSGTFRLGKL